MRIVLVCLALVACKKEPTMTVEQYEAKNTGLMNGVTALFAADGTDCGKLATDLDRFMKEHDDDMQHVVAYEGAHPTDKAAFDEKAGNKLLADFGDKAKPGLAACMDDPKFKAVWDRFTKS
jgi:hypothetical protein